MSRFKKLSHTIWHCQYHMVWTPKYRLRILEGDVAGEVASCVRAFSEQKQCEVLELNIQKDHVHLVVMIPPKISLSEYMGIIKGMKKIDANKSAEEWLQKLDLLDRKKEKLNTLSKGNQQKVQFISSIIHNPSFAILDEPFAGFDPINQEAFLSIIKELRDNGTTVLLSAHQMHLIEKIGASNAAVAVTDCPTCRMQMEAFGGKPVMHPVEVLAARLNERG